MITDWKGNEIKPGMEVAFLQTVRHVMGGGIMWPGRYAKDGKPFFEETVKAHDEPCWILSEWMVVQKSADDGRLYVTEVENGANDLEGYVFRMNVYLGEKNGFSDSPPVLAIKGVSDIKPDKI